jgi:hypothetical protein
MASWEVMGGFGFCYVSEKRHLRGSVYKGWGSRDFIMIPTYTHKSRVLNVFMYADARRRIR